MKIGLFVIFFLWSLSFFSNEEKLYVDEDLEAVLWAESPLFYNPTNIDVDHKGRVWITEAVEYRGFKNKAEDRFNFKGKGDRVVILEDTDDDGKADKSTVFVQDQDLQAPLGIAVIGNKVIVSCAPHVLIYTDSDGDDHADEKEIFLTGFGGFDHDHSLHSFVVGPDGKWYFNVGNAGPHVVTDKSGWTLRSGSVYTGGTPYNSSNHGSQLSDDGKVWVGGLALRVNPDGTGLKVLAHNFRNSYEVALDSYGNMWQNDNDDQVIACRTSFVMEGADVGYFSKNGERTWQADRRPNQDLFTAHWHQENPGVLPFGDKTGAGSPTGVMVYEGMALGEERNGMLLSCEAGRNVVFSYQNQKNESGFIMNRGLFAGSYPVDDENYIWNQKEKDTKKWFRPSDAAASTDGAIYIADWYDPVVGGHAMRDKEAYGRIYRIQPKNKKLKRPEINLDTEEGLITAFCSPAVNVRSLGFQGLLKLERKAIPIIDSLLKSENPYIRARALWLLASIDENKVWPFLEDQDLGVVAFRALKNKVPHELLTSKLSSTSNSQILRELAISCRDKSWSEVKGVSKLLFQNLKEEDPYFETAFYIGFSDKAENIWQYLNELYEYSHDDIRFSKTLFQLHPNSTVSLLKDRLESSELSREDKSKSLTALAFIHTSDAVLAMLDLVQHSEKWIADEAKWWVSFRQYNEWEKLYNWEKELEIKLDPVSKRMLQYKKEIITGSLSLIEIQSYFEQMSLHPFGGQLLVNMASQGDLSWDQKKQIGMYIFNNPDQNVRSLAGDYFQRAGGKKISIDLALNMVGNTLDGKRLFKKNCSTCHQVNGEGQAIGPDLSFINKKFDKTTLLDAIINPSADITFGYEPYLLTTKDDKTYYGFILSESKTMTIKDLAGEVHYVKQSEIKDKKAMKSSIMPDPVTMGLSEENLSSITAYLQNINP